MYIDITLTHLDSKFVVELVLSISVIKRRDRTADLCILLYNFDPP